MDKQNCAWTSWLNGYDQELKYVLPSGKVINGVNSIHKGKHEDRITKYMQCDAKFKVYVCFNYILTYLKFYTLAFWLFLTVYEVVLFLIYG